MITSIEIENFKGIGERIKLDINPMTFLFGPNSAGKSSIIQALHYAREVILHENLNAHQTELGGKYIDLGGFKHFVHGRLAEDDKKEVKIKIEVTGTDTIPIEKWEEKKDYRAYGTKDLQHENVIKWLDQFKPEDDNLFTNNPYYLSHWFTNDVISCAIELSIGWDPRMEQAVINSYSAWINKIPVATISKSKECHQLSDFNFDHPLLPESFDECGKIDPYGPVYKQFLAHTEQHGGKTAEEEKRNAWYASRKSTPKPEDLPTWKEYAKASLNDDKNNNSLCRPPHSFLFADIDGPLLWSPKSLLRSEVGKTTTEGKKEKKEDNILRMSWNAFVIIADDYMSLPFRTIRNILRSSQLDLLQYLGPLRESPEDIGKLDNVNKEQPRGAAGLAAWDTLVNAEMKSLDRINFWMSKENGVALGYSIHTEKFSIMNREAQELLKLIVSDSENSDLENFLNNLPAESHVFVIPDGTEIKMHPKDVGTGVSQVVPVIVSAISNQDKFVIMEQPELHLHPKLQAELGDLFIESVKKNNNTLLLETHSEHLILRILRRIREKNDGELPELLPDFSPDDLSVYYIEQSETGTKATRLRVDETGEFIDRWPNGFFEERAEELF